MATRFEFIDLISVTSAAGQITSRYVSAAGNTSGTLFVSTGGVQVAAITMVRHYSAGNFVITSGSGGTVEITDPNVPNRRQCRACEFRHVPTARRRSAEHRLWRSDYARLCGRHRRHPVVGDGRHAAAIALLGDYMAGSFVTADDGHCGTLVTNTAQAESPALAHPRT